MIVQHPKTSSSADGIIELEISGGNIRPYEFKLVKYNGNSETIIGDWSGATNPGGRTKTYSGLTAGIYKGYIDTDGNVGEPHTCVKEKIYVLLAQCEDPCDSNGNGEGGCGNALEIVEKSPVSNTNLPEHVRFKHISQYEIGESDITFSAFVKPNTNNSNFTIVSWDNGFPFRKGADPGTESPFDDDAIQFIIGVIGTNRGGILPPSNTLENPYGTQNGAAIAVIWGIQEDSSFGSPGNRSFKFVTEPVSSWNSEGMNHVVVVVKDLPATQAGSAATLTGADSPLLGVAATGATASTILGKVITVIVNGVEVTGAWDVTYNATIPTSNLTIADRAFLRNWNNFKGPIRLFGRASSYDTGGGVGNLLTSAVSAGTITNFQVYKRALSNKEVQKNYLKGCHGEPAECAGLMLHAPLNQTRGILALETVNGNNGELIGYSSVKTTSVGLGSAWVELCCPKINDSEYLCPAPDCNPEFVEFYATIGGIAQVDESLVAAFVPLLGACPTPSNLPTNAVLEGAKTFFELTPINSTLDLVQAFVEAFNDSVDLDALGIKADKNLETIIIRIPKEYVKYCNQPFSFCLYSGTALVPEPYTGEYTISYPKSNIAICCPSFIGDCANEPGEPIIL